MKTRLLLAAATALALAACGKQAELKPAAGGALPSPAYGATARPTATQLTTASPEARPARSDELLKRSEERQPDPFDLPPE